jgi:predicted transcriptional regulator
VSKAVLISIQPKWCEKIANGKKTVEVRKNRPKLETPFKCYIYFTLPPQTELFTHGCIREYANELIRLQSGEIVYDYGMRICCDTENRPYSRDNFLCKKVIGEFTCDKITYLGNISSDPWELLMGSTHESHKRLVTEKACLTEAELLAYGGQYAWHISHLVIYDKPKELGEFTPSCRYGEDGECIKTKEVLCLFQKHDFNPDGSVNFVSCSRRAKRPPQSWCYVEELPGGDKDNG